MTVLIGGTLKSTLTEYPLYDYIVLTSILFCSLTHT